MRLPVERLGMGGKTGRSRGSANSLTWSSGSWGAGSFGLRQQLHALLSSGGTLAWKLTGLGFSLCCSASRPSGFPELGVWVTMKAMFEPTSVGRVARIERSQPSCRGGAGAETLGARVYAGKGTGLGRVVWLWDL